MSKSAKCGNRSTLGTNISNCENLSMTAIKRLDFVSIRVSYSLIVYVIPVSPRNDVLIDVGFLPHGNGFDPVIRMCLHDLTLSHVSASCFIFSHGKLDFCLWLLTQCCLCFAEIYSNHVGWFLLTAVSLSSLALTISPGGKSLDLQMDLFNKLRQMNFDNKPHGKTFLSFLKLCNTNYSSKRSWCKYKISTIRILVIHGTKIIGVK